jgi:NitT/TauT family transport system substrate-binding protein
VYFVRRQATRPRRIKNKLTSTTDMPNYLNYLYLDALEAVMPKAVKGIH